MSRTSDAGESSGARDLRGPRRGGTGPLCSTGRVFPPCAARDIAATLARHSSSARRDDLMLVLEVEEERRWWVGRILVGDVFGVSSAMDDRDVCESTLPCNRVMISFLASAAATISSNACMRALTGEAGGRCDSFLTRFLGLEESECVTLWLKAGGAECGGSGRRDGGIGGSEA